MGTAFLGLVESVSILILALTLVVFARGGLYAGSPDGTRLQARELLRSTTAIALGAWLSEVSCIRVYRFYQYDAPWALFLDVMPLLVVLIWPVVVLSAREVAWSLGWRNLRGEPLAGAVFCLVVLDASLVEAVAVTSGLWSWNEPGFFHVPWIGVLGWGFYAAAVSGVWDLSHRKRWGAWAWIGVPGAAVALTHLALLGSWWGGLRWLGFLRTEAPPELLVPGAWLGAALLTAVVWKRKARAGLRVMGPRIAAAFLFLTLVWLQRSRAPNLFAFAAAFPWPYLAATSWRWSSGPAQRPTG